MGNLEARVARSIAMSIFSLDITKALKILEKGTEKQDNNLFQTLAMAIAGK